MLALEVDMLEMGQRAKIAAGQIACASATKKTKALHNVAHHIEKNAEKIIAANQKDIENAINKAMSAALIDRLKLDNKRVQAIADSVRIIADLPDPVGAVISQWSRPNGLNIKRVRTPLGVIGVIYESRPNVTADAGALCFKSGNAVILRGGADSFFSSQAIHQAFITGLKQADFTADCVQLVATTDRAAVGEMLKGLNGAIDVIVPRGGKSLVARVQSEARVPVFAHLEGICHIYIDQSANIDMACKIVANAKMRRTGVCGAVETLLIDQKNWQKFLPVLQQLKQLNCQIRATQDIVDIFSDAALATKDDWSTEYLDAIISVKLVDGITGAIEHIQQYSSHHTEAIIAEDADIVATFFNRLDSAILLHNASTQFADGGEFGFGAEIGIATGKMHARGPIGVEQLTSFQYQIDGNGQIRP